MVNPREIAGNEKKEKKKNFRFNPDTWIYDVVSNKVDA